MSTGDPFLEYIEQWPAQDAWGRSDILKNAAGIDAGSTLSHDSVLELIKLGQRDASYTNQNQTAFLLENRAILAVLESDDVLAILEKGLHAAHFHPKKNVLHLAATEAIAGKFSREQLLDFIEHAEAHRSAGVRLAALELVGTAPVLRKLESSDLAAILRTALGNREIFTRAAGVIQQKSVREKLGEQFGSLMAMAANSFDSGGQATISPCF